MLVFFYFSQLFVFYSFYLFNNMLIVTLSPNPTSILSFLVQKGGSILQLLKCLWNQEQSCACVHIQIYQNEINGNKFLVLKIRK